MNFIEKLNTKVAKNNSLVCIGLDSEFEKIPECLKKGKRGNTPRPDAALDGRMQAIKPSSRGEFSSRQRAEIVLEFNRAIIDATKDVVCAYKPNSAFYEAIGARGIEILRQTIKYIQKVAPDVPVILDAKRADIGSTNNAYVAFAFSYLGADAITVHPYLGKEAVKPFLEQKDKGIFVLCRTSNPGAGEFQDLVVEASLRDGENASSRKEELYRVVARRVAREWNVNGNCGLVVGATYPEELKIVRSMVGDMPILVPGIGAQGGDVEKTVRAGITAQGGGIIVNSSRGIIFASSGEDFAQAAQKETMKLKEEINKYRNI